MEVILIPGLWLDGSSWDRVGAAIDQAGHKSRPITLPGMESKDADRSGIDLRDHVAAVVAAIDACNQDDGRVLIVAHSAGGGVAHAVRHGACKGRGEQ